MEHFFMPESKKTEKKSGFFEKRLEKSKRGRYIISSVCRKTTRRQSD